MTAPDSIAARLVALEAENAVRRLVARYFRLCDRLDGGSDISLIGALFTQDARWRGGGSYGVYEGRTAILAMLHAYCAPMPHFRLNAHFLTGEDIRVDGDAAVGRWTMLQCSTYHDGTSDLRSAALTIGCAVEDGRWRIADFLTESLFSRRVDRWSDAAAIPVPVMPRTI